jgi:hypothetical protein
VPHSNCRITDSLLLHGRVFRAVMTSRNLTMALTADGRRAGSGRLMMLMKLDVRPYSQLLAMPTPRSAKHRLLTAYNSGGGGAPLALTSVHKPGAQPLRVLHIVRLYRQRVLTGAYPSHDIVYRAIWLRNG